MNISSLIYGVLLFFGAHIVTWFQLNGQFKWDWFVKNEWLMVLIGIPISFLYIWATKYSVNGFGGLLWPTRFIGFGVGMVVYAIFVSYFFNEAFTPKTIISLLLALILICIQVLWK
jgi:multidrug transporter EmrE-like cation transporter